MARDYGHDETRDCAFVPLLLSILMLTESRFPSPHFIVHELEPGVYAAIATDGGRAISNAGIIDLATKRLSMTR